MSETGMVELDDTKAVRNRKTKLRVVAEELVDALSFAETSGRASESAD